MSSISIIIPVYNESDLIKKVAIQLLDDLNKSNTISNFEIILIENGSWDNSDLLVDELSEMDDRISVNIIFFIRSNLLILIIYPLTE